MRPSWATFLFCAAACAQTLTQEIDIPVNPVWTDTGIEVRPGDSIVITADGTLQLPLAKTADPAGQSRGFRDLLKAYPVNQAGLGALIGRIGSSDVSEPFLVGARKELQVRRAGRLFLGINA